MSINVSVGEEKKNLLLLLPLVLGLGLKTTLIGLQEQGVDRGEDEGEKRSEGGGRVVQVHSVDISEVNCLGRWWGLVRVKVVLFVWCWCL